MSGETSGGGTIVGNVVGASMFVNEGGATGGAVSDAGFHDCPTAIVVLVDTVSAEGLGEPTLNTASDNRTIERYFI